MTDPHPTSHRVPPLTRLGFGGAAIGNLFTAVSDQDAAAAVNAAWDNGIRYFDTAPHYGLGLSERRIGAALRERPREQFVVSTKVGRILEPVAAPGDAVGRDTEGGFDVPADRIRRWDFSADGVRRSIEESLERLGLDRIDVVYIHDPDDHVEQAIGQAYPALAELREQGVVSAIGVGMNQTAVPARFVRETDIDVVLLAGRYTLLDRAGADELLPAALERGVQIVLGGVFNSGLLADPRTAATYDYRPASQQLVRQALAIEEVCEEYDVPLRAAALQFGFNHPAVASVLIGIRSPEQARDCAAMAGVTVPETLWSRLGSRPTVR
jgi:D-threo-aldose 1-dehydrogenase